MLVGSRALAWWNKDFKQRIDSDWDYIAKTQFNTFGLKSEFHSEDELNNKRAVELYNTEDGVCNIKGLALIKRSHLHRDHFFDKHITMYHKYLKPCIGDLTEEDKDFLKERTKLTKLKYPQPQPSLNMSNKDFFDDAVTKKYDHDWLHELYAYENRPMYEKLKNPEGMDSAWCSKDLWDKLSLEEKLKCVAEEVYVISTERFLVPNDYNFPPKLAYLNALKKVCTTLTSGWFRDFAIDYYPEVIDMFDLNKVNKVKEKLV